MAFRGPNGEANKKNWGPRAGTPQNADVSFSLSHTVTYISFNLGSGNLLYTFSKHYLYVQEEHGMCTVSFEFLGVVFTITFDAYKVHKVAPLLLEQVLASFETIEKEVACP